MVHVCKEKQGATHPAGCPARSRHCSGEGEPLRACHVWQDVPRALVEVQAPQREHRGGRVSGILIGGYGV